MGMDFTVKLDRFEGPYTKLLEMIEGRKLSITEVTLASLADEYIAYIKTLKENNLVDVSQFIVVASTLMLMKAKSLLPSLTYTGEEEKQVHDLEYKLELYALLSKGVGTIASLYGSKPLYGRDHGIPFKEGLFVPDSRITPVFLQSIAELTLLSFAPPKPLPSVQVDQSLRIEKVIEGLMQRITSLEVVSLQSVAEGTGTKEEQKKVLIVTFMALLELLKNGMVHAEQTEDGGDITILPKQENKKEEKIEVKSLGDTAPIAPQEEVSLSEQPVVQS
jgi:segregation and condensation protein A